jgi:protein TonB
VLVTIIAVQKKSLATETVATVQSPEPTPTPTASETALIPNTNEPTPSPSVSPTEKKQETPSPTPTPTVGSVENTQAVSSATPTPAVEIITPTPTPTPTPRPAPQPSDPNRIYSNREVTEKARISSQPKPAYTEEARKNQIQGVVVLRVVLKSDGTIGNVSVISGLPYGLTEQAIAAARNIRFTPAQKDAVPVTVSMQVEYVFNVY